MSQSKTIILTVFGRGLSHILNPFLFYADKNCKAQKPMSMRCCVCGSCCNSLSVFKGNALLACSDDLPMQREGHPVANRLNFVQHPDKLYYTRGGGHVMKRKGDG